MQSTIAWKRRRKWSAEISTPTLTFISNWTPSQHQLLEPAVEDVFFQLEIGNPVAEQTAEAVAALEDDDVVPQPGKLLRGGKPGGTRADYGHLLARLRLRTNRLDPAFGERTLDDPKLDVLDVHRLAADRQRAGGFAGSGTDAAGDLGEIVGRMQVLGRLAPATPVNEIVELGNAILHRAADGMAERNAAVHAAGRLLVQRLIEQLAIDLVPIADALLDRPMLDFDSRILQESGGVGHPAIPSGRNTLRSFEFDHDCDAASG